MCVCGITMHNMSSTYSAVSWGNWKQKMELYLAPRGGHMGGLKKKEDGTMVLLQLCLKYPY